MPKISPMQRESVVNCINCFGQGFPPARDLLVLDDGCDELEKRYALEIFSEKSGREILGDIGFGKNLCGLLEGLIVLTPQSFIYYVKPFLIYLANLLSEQEDGELDFEYISWLFFDLAEFFRINGVGFLNEEQINCLRCLANLSISSIDSGRQVEIIEVVSRFLACPNNFFLTTPTESPRASITTPTTARRNKPARSGKARHTAIRLNHDQT